MIGEGRRSIGCGGPFLLVRRDFWAPFPAA